MFLPLCYNKCQIFIDVVCEHQIYSIINKTAESQMRSVLFLMLEKGNGSCFECQKDSTFNCQTPITATQSIV